MSGPIKTIEKTSDITGRNDIRHKEVKNVNLYDNLSAKGYRAYYFVI